jgi:KTSC domain
MDHTPVESTTLASVGYDAAARMLELEFRSGERYRYLDVPLSLYRDLLSADSKGRFFNHHIRNRFSHTLLLGAS